MRTFGEWLRGVRGERSQQSVADACPRGAGIFQSRIHDFESGDRLPSEDQLMTLLDALSLDSAARLEGQALLALERASQFRARLASV